MKNLIPTILTLLSLQSNAQCDSSYVYTNTFGTVVGRGTMNTGVTTLTYDNSGAINDGNYVLTNNLNTPPNPSSFFGNGQAASVCTCSKLGHTQGLDNDAFFVVNSPSSNPFYTFTITGVSPPYQYEFSYWAINIHKSGSGQLSAKIRVILTDAVANTVITSFSNTLPFTTSWTWVKYSVVIFPVNSSIKVQFFDDESGTKGNDFALDDIRLQKQCAQILPLDSVVSDPVYRTVENPVRYDVYDMQGRLIWRRDYFDFNKIKEEAFIVKIIYKHHITVIKYRK